MQAQQQAVRVEDPDLIGARRLHPQDHIAGIALSQQLLQALEERLGVVDGGARGLAAHVGSLSCGGKGHGPAEEGPGLGVPQPGVRPYSGAGPGRLRACLSVPVGRGEACMCAKALPTWGSLSA